jgi:hypothetical protein
MGEINIRYNSEKSQMNETFGRPNHRLGYSVTMNRVCEATDKSELT